MDEVRNHLNIPNHCVCVLVYEVWQGPNSGFDGRRGYGEHGDTNKEIHF